MRRLAVMPYVLGKSTVCRKPAARQIRRHTIKLLGYLCNNADSLPNYGRRYREGGRTSSAFVESAVNQLIDKRMSKFQQMRWDPRSAHLLPQVRVRVVDGQLSEDFARWYLADPTKSLALPNIPFGTGHGPQRAHHRLNIWPQALPSSHQHRSVSCRGEAVGVAFMGGRHLGQRSVRPSCSPNLSPLAKGRAPRASRQSPPHQYPACR